MAGDDQKIWDERHASKHGQGEPSPFLKEILESNSWRIQPGRAIDIATGRGRNALFLAERGFSVEAIDVSTVALEQGRKAAQEKKLAIDFRQADLDSTELPEAAYDLILNFNFLQRALIPK
ncbi:MAG: class I SAM-dependent methyltransferase, partial [Candidatus Binatota bacterium]